MARQRRRKERRERAAPEEGSTPPPPAPVKRAAAPQGVSWLGLIGGLMGVGPMAAIAVGLVLEPPEAGAALAALPALMAAVYVPAVWASIAQTGSRRGILRGSVVASLALAFAASFLFGFVVLVVLAPPTALLWLGSGGLRPRR